MGLIDFIVLGVFFAIVMGVSLFKSRNETTGDDYFLAGRNLPWWMIGFSLIAANISTEQFVGMNGGAAGSAGMAIASYDWIAAIALVFVAIVFLPKFLSSGITTMPQFLEYRYSEKTRSIMAIYTVIVYVGVTISAVLFSGGLTLHTIFDMKLTTGVWIIGITAALYTTWGGLMAVAWADLFLGSALLIGGGFIAYFGFIEVGGVAEFAEVNEAKLHMILPKDHDVLPWTALVFGLWIPNLYYWGLNQYICQRTLAARSLKDGQLGVLMAAVIQIFLPLIIVIPGIMAFQLYGDQMQGSTDSALPLLIRNLVPTGLKGFIFAAIAGAVISSLASMLNSASTVATIDIVGKRMKLKENDPKVVTIGRIFTVVFVLIGCLIAPFLNHPSLKGIFSYMQEFQGFISPGILAAFLVGVLSKKAPAKAGTAALVASPVIYFVLQALYGNIPAFESISLGEIAFLNRMGITFVLVLAIMAFMTWKNPLSEPKTLPKREGILIETDRSIYVIGAIVVVTVIVLYAVFW